MAFNLVAREALDDALVFNLFFVCPVTAEPPTDREVPVFRDLFSCKKRLLKSDVLGTLLRNAGPCHSTS